MTDVEVLRWPEDATTIQRAVTQGTPVLLIVESGIAPPVNNDCCRDWMWETGGETERRFRIRQLALRALAHGKALPRVDELGILHFGLRSIPLPPKEQLLMEPLLARFGRPVAIDELVRAAWPTTGTRLEVVRVRVAALRRRIAGVGLVIEGRRGTYALRQAQLAGFDAEGAGFDEA